MAKIIGYNQKQKTRQKMQTVILNIKIYGDRLLFISKLTTNRPC